MNVHISIIIPVFHEALIINQVLEDIYRHGTAINFEVIVVDGSRENDTLKAINDTRVIKISSPKGRGIQMNSGAKQAKGGILLFLHADTFLPVNGLDRIYNSLSSKKYVGGAFDLRIKSELKIKSRKKYYRIIEKTASIRSRITGIPYGDQAIFIDKNYFFKLKGFKEIQIMEDVDLMSRIKKNGGKIIILPLKVQTSSRRWDSEGVVYGTLRNWFLMAFYLMGAAPGKLAAFYKQPVWAAAKKRKM